MVEIQRKLVVNDWYERTYDYRWYISDSESGGWHHTEAQAQFDYVCMRLEDLSKRVQDIEAKTNG